MKTILQLMSSNKTLIKGNNKIKCETGSLGLTLIGCNQGHQEGGTEGARMCSRTLGSRQPLNVRYSPQW